MAIRGQGSKLVFLDLVSDEQKVQVMIMQNKFQGGDEAFVTVTHSIRRGDLLGVVGVIGKTKAGELSIRANDVIQLSYCLHQLPT